MSNDNGNMPAVPCQEMGTQIAMGELAKGLTKREHFAAMAMLAITTGGRMMNGDAEYYANLAVKSADALLEALEDK